MNRPGHPGGERHHRAKLTDEQVRAMRDRWADWKRRGLVRKGPYATHGFKHLAREFGCEVNTAKQIIYLKNRRAA